MYNEGELTKEAFGEHHIPQYENQKQVEQFMMELQGDIDALRMQSLDSINRTTNLTQIPCLEKVFSKVYQPLLIA